MGTKNVESALESELREEDGVYVTFEEDPLGGVGCGTLLVETHDPLHDDAKDELKQGNSDGTNDTSREVSRG